MPRKQEFTPKMRLAFEHYANDPLRNKANAYRAGYDCSRMTIASVSVRATELFKHPIMAEKVAELAEAVKERSFVDATYVAEKLKLIAEFNISKFLVLQSDGSVVYDFTEATEDDWYCIDECTIDAIPRGTGDDKYEVEKIKLKSNSKLKAIELLGRMTNVNAFAQQKDVGSEDRQKSIADSLAEIAGKLPS